MGRRWRELSNEFPIHITARCNNREKFPIPLHLAWELFCDYLFLMRLEFNLRTLSFVLMPNHFHLLAMDPDLRLSECMTYFMRETSKEMGRMSGRINRIWGRPYHNSIIQSPLYFLHAYKYVYRNPVKGKIATSVLNYPYSSLQLLLGLKNSCLIIEEDETLFSNPESVIKWMDISFNEDHETAIQRGLKKKVLKFGLDRKTKKPFYLDSWNSVPPFLRDFSE